MRGMGRVFKRGSAWWISYYHRGKEFRESSGSESEAQAGKLLKKRLGEIGRGRLIGPVEEKVTFEEMAEDLLRDYETNGKRSLRSARLSVSHLRGFFGLDRALDITTDRVRAYISQRQSERASNGSINRVRDRGIRMTGSLRGAGLTTAARKCNRHDRRGRTQMRG